MLSSDSIAAIAGSSSIFLTASPLAEHLALWSNEAKLNDAFLQARHLDTDQLFAVRHELQQEIEAMVSVKDELCGQFPTR